MGCIIFLNRYFYPDHSASSQILSDLAFHLAASGRDIRVIASQQRYDDPTARLPSREMIRGVDVQRITTTRFGRSTLVGRGIDYLSFYVSAWRALRASTTSGDIIVAKTDPPLLSILATLVARQRGAHLVNWLQDLYPEVAAKLGVPLLDGRLGMAISYLRDRSLKSAAANVVVGEMMAARIRARGILPARIHVVPNWQNDKDIQPIRPADNTLRHQWGLTEKFVIGYSGNLGRAHEFETVLAASEKLRDRSDILFLFVGGGHQIDGLARRVKERHLERTYLFLPYQETNVLAQVLSVPDIHWISLIPEMEGLIVPSKFYGIAAAGRPIIAITAKNGEIAQLVSAHQCGIAIEIGHSDDFAKTIALLSTDPQRVAEMGKRARTMLDMHFSRRAAFERWNAVLDAVAAS